MESNVRFRVAATLRLFLAGAALAVGLVAAFLFIFTFRTPVDRFPNAASTPGESSYGASGILGEAQLTRDMAVSAVILPLTGTRFIAARYDYGKSGDRFGRGKLWLVDLDGSPKGLVEDSIPWNRTQPDSQVAISPDGSAVAYIAVEGEEDLLNVMNVVSGQKQTLRKSLSR